MQKNVIRTTVNGLVSFLISDLNEMCLRERVNCLFVLLNEITRPRNVATHRSKQTLIKNHSVPTTVSGFGDQNHKYCLLLSASVVLRPRGGVLAG